MIATHPVQSNLLWSREPGLAAWPLEWQRPARTEEWAWEQWVQAAPTTRFAQLLAFPWATLIDLLDRGHSDRARPMLAALDAAPISTTLIRATVCQHIRMPALLPRFRALGITDVFWAHARVGDPSLDGVRIHPFPLFPVRCHDNPSAASDPTPLAARSLLYSFVGAYAPEGYLTPVRQWIFDLPPQPNALVQRRADWHYEPQVYGEQVGGRSMTDDERRRTAERGAEYDRTLLDSVFSLCPSGSGPNSIRLWESLGFGCIPVLLADTLRLPGEPAEWDEAIVRVSETREAVAGLPALLSRLAADPERLARMRQAGRRLWQRYGERGPLEVLGVLGDTGWVRSQVAPGRVPITQAETA